VSTFLKKEVLTELLTNVLNIFELFEQPLKKRKPENQRFAGF
jgi:hypothetical protein